MLVSLDTVTGVRGGAPASAAIRARGSTSSDPGTSFTGRRAIRDSQTIGLPSATTRSCAP